MIGLEKLSFFAPAHEATVDGNLAASDTGDALRVKLMLRRVNSLVE